MMLLCCLYGKIKMYVKQGNLRGLGENLVEEMSLQAFPENRQL